MIYTSHYNSPIGDILLASKNNELIGLWIDNQKYYLPNYKEELIENNNIDIIIKTKEWLNNYFNKKNPSLELLSLNPIGTPFQKKVWSILKTIPYGKTMTYNDIAKIIAEHKGIPKMSAQAIGGAVSRNPISIIIPCHRVVGTNGSLTGYAGGLDKKIYLLNHEGVDMTKLYNPDRK